MEKFGIKLKEVRKAKGFTQKELGAAVGISEVMIGQYERGIRTPKFEMRKKLADALGITIYELLGISPMQALKDDTTFSDYLESNGCMVSDFFEGADYAFFWESENVTIPLTNSEFQEFKENLKEYLEMELKRLRKQKGL